MSFRIRSLIGLLALAIGEQSSEELEAEKPQLLNVTGSDNIRPKHGLELQVLQRHGRAPLPPEKGRIPSSEDELMQEFDEVIVEYKTNLYLTSIMLRLPEKQQQMEDSSVNFDGYKFFTGPNNECKFQLGDKSLLPSNDTQVARDLAGTNEISSCVADNSDTAGNMKPRRSTAHLKFHPHPFEHNESGWRYFSMMIRNPQKTPEGSSMDGEEANTFQIIMNTTYGETVASMSFEALPIKPFWVCSYTPWVLTTPCTADCGGGFRTRVRRKLHANPEGYEFKRLKNCHEKIEEHESCNTQECDVDCQLSEWTPWANGECSRSCGNGTMVERRNVVMGPKGNGRICPPWSAEGVRLRVVPCNTEPCPASRVESPLAKSSEELVEKANSEFRVFTDIPPAGVTVLPEVKEVDGDGREEDKGSAEEDNETDSKGKGSEESTGKEDNEKDKEEEEDKAKEESKDKENSNGKENDHEKEENEEKDKKEEGKEKEDSDEKDKSEVNENEDEKEESNEKGKEEEENKEKEDSNEKESSNEKDDNSAEEAGQVDNTGEDNEDNDNKQSLLSLGETPKIQLGLSKSSCSEPCGGGRRLVLIPSEQKVSSEKEDKSCYTAFEEDCNVFECQPFMLQPASPWQFPVVGKWFMVDVDFVVEELAESLTLRAPPDFLLAATGESSECFLVEHGLPNLENCTVYPGQASDKTGPIIVLDFSNPLEPQNSHTKKQDWYFIRFWVQHPEHCSGGRTSDGRCLGVKGEREWTLSLQMSEPSKLWELVKGSYEIYVDEESARAASESNAAKNLPFIDPAEEVEATAAKLTNDTAVKETSSETDESKGESFIQRQDTRRVNRHRDHLERS